MKKTALVLLSCLTSMVFAGNSDQSRVYFYNNTKVPVVVEQNILIGGLLECQKVSCVKSEESINLPPYSSKSILLESEVKDNQTHTGGLGFTIRMVDKTVNRVLIPALANPKGIFIQQHFNESGDTWPDAAGSVQSIAYDSLPLYTVSVAQNITFHQMFANQTVISINSVK